MLVSFEGPDGAGKTTVLTAVAAKLRRRGREVVAVEEFSASSYGVRLLDALAVDKFLRPVAGQDATAVTRALEVVADLYFLDARVIGPAAARGAIVVKDRHVDTVLYTLTPALLDAGVFADQEPALAWLQALFMPLQVPPSLTVYVDAPLQERLRRIGSRRRHLVEDRADQVNDDDLRVFEARDAIARRLIAAEPNRFLVVENSSRPVDVLAVELANLVVSRLPAP
jgi:thymidylate kinase